MGNNPRFVFPPSMNTSNKVLMVALACSAQYGCLTIAAQFLYGEEMRLAANATRPGVHQEGDDKAVQTCEHSLASKVNRKAARDLPKTSAKMRIRIMPTKSRGC
jgi:hypothetical protein